MTDRELEEKLARAAFHAAPNDLDGVLSRCKSQKGKVMTMKKSNKNRALALAACLALLLAGGSGLAWQQANAVASVVSLDVNPSIELEVNKKQKVLECDALNADGEKVLFEMNGGDDLKGTKLDVAVNALVGALVRHGYLDDISSAILVSVEDKDEQRAAQLEAQLTASVDAALQRGASQATVIGQVVSGSGTQAEGVSTGKAAMVDKLVAMNPQLSFDTLAGLSVEELYAVGMNGAKELPIGKDAALAAALAYSGASSANQVDAHVDPELDDVPAHYEVELYHAVLGEVDYEVDAYTGEILLGRRDALKDAPAAPGQISQEEAENIALKDAGLKRDGGAAILTQKDFDNGKVLWDVEIFFQGVEYDYDIDAVTGAIVSREHDKDALGIIGGADGPTAIVTQDSISKQSAVDAALKQAGFTQKQVANLVVDQDVEDAEWDVEFTANGVKYDYTVSSRTGAIVKSEQEILEQPTAGAISEAQARKVCLDFAKLAENQVTNLKSEFDREDNTWEVQFLSGGQEWEFEVDGTAGSILKWEQDIAD